MGTIGEERYLMWSVPGSTPHSLMKTRFLALASSSSSLIAGLSFITHNERKIDRSIA
jgi:hypothetical protein